MFKKIVSIVYDLRYMEMARYFDGEVATPLLRQRIQVATFISHKYWYGDTRVNRHRAKALLIADGYNPPVDDLAITQKENS